MICCDSSMRSRERKLSNKTFVGLKYNFKAHFFIWAKDHYMLFKQYRPQASVGYLSNRPQVSMGYKLINLRKHIIADFNPSPITCIIFPSVQKNIVLRHLQKRIVCCDTFFKDYVTAMYLGAGSYCWVYWRSWKKRLICHSKSVKRTLNLFSGFPPKSASRRTTLKYKTSCVEDKHFEVLNSFFRISRIQYRLRLR